MTDRIKKLQEAIEAEGLDALIVTNPANIFYLTGANDPDSERGFLLAVSKKDWKMVAARFYQARMEATIGRNSVLYAERGESLSKCAGNFLGKGNRIGFEKEDVAYARYERFKKNLRGNKLAGVGNLLVQFRRIKSEGELALIKKAASITDRTFALLQKLIKPGASEIALKRKITEIMQDMGATGGSFDPIVASGRNSADPHYEGANKKIKSGEMVLIDMGARYKNYDADLTRMVFVGKATAKFKEIYNIVLQAQEKALKDCILGAATAQIYDKCVANFKRYGQETHFTHSLGHGVGIEIHEEPSLGPGSTATLGNGMVFTVEPGLYYLGWGGIRIEDLCAMRDGKMVRFSKAPKNLIEV
jgi:Xaa-Pro aminopeptidase